MFYSPSRAGSRSQSTIIAGGGNSALVALCDLSAASLQTIVFAANPSPELEQAIQLSPTRLIRRKPAAADLMNAAEVFAVADDPAEDARVLNLARVAGARCRQVVAPSINLPCAALASAASAPVAFYHL